VRGGWVKGDLRGQRKKRGKGHEGAQREKKNPGNLAEKVGGPIKAKRGTVDWGRIHKNVKPGNPLYAKGQGGRESWGIDLRITEAD